MYFNAIIHFCFFFIGLHSFAQQKIASDTVAIIPIKLVGTNYKQYMAIEKDIYAISKGDSLIVFNIESNQIKKIIPEIVAIGKTSKNKIFFLDTKGRLRETNDFIKSNKIGRIKGQFAKILIDRNDHYVVISEEGIYYQKTNYIPFEDKEVYRPKTNKKEDKANFFKIPDVSFINSKNQMILTYDYGEFGGHAVFFDLNAKTFLKTDTFSTSTESKTIGYYSSDEYRENLLSTYPNQIKKDNGNIAYKYPNGMPFYRGVKGIAENLDGELLVSQSLMHFLVSGALILTKESQFPNFYYSKKIENVLQYRKLFGENGGLEMLNEYLGPTAFNTFDNSFFYFSDKGFFKIIKDRDIYTKELFFAPKLFWKGGLEHSVGYQMSVIKFEFISKTELLFLTSNNGIGYFDGKLVKYFQ